MIAMELRPASPGQDLEQIAALYVSCFSAPPWNESWSIADAHQRMSALLGTASCRSMVAQRDRQIVGVAIGQLEAWQGKNIFLLQELFVAPASQKAGIGTTLLSELIGVLTADESLVSVYLLTDRESSAQSFYEKFGFAPSPKKLVMSASVQKLIKSPSQ